MMFYKKLALDMGKHCIADKTDHRPALVASCLLSLHLALLFSERASEEEKSNKFVENKKRHKVYIKSKIGRIDQRFQSSQPFQS